MRSGFIHGLWADPSFERSIVKTLPEVAAAAGRPFRPPARFYCYGRKNQGHAQEHGYETVLMDERPLAWQGLALWRHKVEIWNIALHDFDEIIWLDLDAWPLKAWDDANWNRLRQGPPLQAALMVYRRPQLLWDRADRNIVPHGSFVYLRDRGIAAELLTIVTEHENWKDEVAMAWWIDQQMGGWQGAEAYYRAGYEPFCATHQRSPLPVELNSQKNAYFRLPRR